MLGVAVAKALGAEPVILTGTRDRRLAIGKQLGADHVVNVTKEDPVAAVKRITSGKGLEYGLECSGAPNALNEAAQMVNRGVRICLAAFPHEPAMVDIAHLVRNNIYVFGIRGEGRSATYRAAALMAQKRFDAKLIHTHTFPLADLPTALKYALDRIENAIKVVVFATVAGGIAGMGDIRRGGGIGVRARVYFEVVSTLALVVGMAGGNILPAGEGLHIDPRSLDTKPVAGSLTIADFLMKMVPANIVGDLAKGEIMPVLAMAVLFGFALIHMGERGQRLIGLIGDLTHAVFGVVRLIMMLAPLAAFAAMAFTIGKFVFGTLISLGKLIASVYVTSLLFVLIGLGSVARLFGLRLWKLVRYFKDELLIAFSATSGEAMIPRAIVKLEAMGCSRKAVGLVLPTGFSFNMDGTAIYMTIAALFIAQATDIPLNLGQQLTMVLVMLFTSKGAAGITGGGFVALAATLPALDVLPLGGLALLVGVDRFMAEIRAVTNLFGNIFATVVVAKWTGELDGAKAAQVLDGGIARPSYTRLC